MIYGYGGTIHGTQKLNIEIDKRGGVVSVWFRCCALPFDVTVVGENRAIEMANMSDRINKHSKLNAVDIEMDAPAQPQEVTEPPQKETIMEVTDRMQGVDCCYCEENVPHIHPRLAAPAAQEVPAEQREPSKREYYHEAIEKVLAMRKIDLANAEQQPSEKEYYFGRAHRWGDVAMVGRRVVAGNLRFGEYVQPLKAQKFNPDQTDHPAGSWFAIANSKNRGAHTKVPGFRFDGNGGSFQSASVKVAGLDWSKHGTPGYKAQGFNVTAAQRFREGVKSDDGGWQPNGSLVSSQRMVSDGFKHRDEDGYKRNHPAAFGWKSPRTNSRSDSRKAASAQIAKIPFPLAQHIARVFKESHELCEV